MLESFIHRLYGDLAGRGVFPEQQGQAQVTWPGRAPYSSPIVAYVGPDAARFIGCDLPPGNFNTGELRVEGIEVKGTLEDGRQLTALGSPIHFDLRVNVAGQSRHIVLKVEGPEMTLSTPDITDSGPFRVEWTLLNALFEGIDWTPRDSGAGSRSDSFQFSSKSHQWTIRWHPSFEESDKQSLKDGRIQVLPTAVISTEISDVSSVPTVEDEAFAITRLLSLVTGASVGAAGRRIMASGTVVSESFIEWPLNGSAANYVNYQLVPNYPLAGALREFLNQTIDSYRDQESELHLTGVIGYLEQARTNQFIDIRLALTIFALEALTHQLSLKLGVTPEQLEKQNIEQKLNRAHNQLGMRFINKKFGGDTRADIRNPLLHSGQIPNLTMAEKVSWYDELYSLAFKMLLFLLGYKGKWLDPAQGHAAVDAPQ